MSSNREPGKREFKFCSALRRPLLGVLCNSESHTVRRMPTTEIEPDLPVPSLPFLPLPPASPPARPPAAPPATYVGELTAWSLGEEQTTQLSPKAARKLSHNAVEACSSCLASSQSLFCTDSHACLPASHRPASPDSTPHCRCPSVFAWRGIAGGRVSASASRALLVISPSARCGGGDASPCSSTGLRPC